MKGVKRQRSKLREKKMKGMKVLEGAKNGLGGGIVKNKRSGKPPLRRRISKNGG